MTSSAQQLAAPAAPMSARRRFGIAGASSVTFHALLLLVVGLLARHTPTYPPVLIPIELTVADQVGGKLLLGAGGHPEAEPKAAASPSTAPKPQKTQPSSPGGRAKSAPAPPKLLTSKRGTEPSGPQGVGKEAAGPGGREEAPAGPTRGPGIVGGPGPVYPKDALDQGLEGSVTIAVLVAEDGSPSSATVGKSSGHALLDQAAVRAVQKGWAFQPGLKEGKPAPGKVDITFEFTAGKVHRR